MKNFVCRRSGLGGPVLERVYVCLSANRTVACRQGKREHPSLCNAYSTRPAHLQRDFTASLPALLFKCTSLHNIQDAVSQPCTLRIRARDNDHLPREGLSPLGVYDEAFTLFICACLGVVLGLLSMLPWLPYPEFLHASGEPCCARAFLSVFLLSWLSLVRPAEDTSQAIHPPPLAPS
ncbi:hypothetical protein PENSPDRAFT_432722 [Peniophora sp. CONT]|nr:hypothetical protein PENSPDRAFT_432722 [Peniophora sp. CONT]